MKANTMLKKLLFIIAICFIVPMGVYAAEEDRDDDEYDQQEVIIVNRIPRGAYAATTKEEAVEFHNVGWYEIGLSRNGEEPVEYIWHAERGPYSFTIGNAKIGDRGTISLNEWAKQIGLKLPRPNANNPPLIGAFGEMHWEKQK